MRNYGFYGLGALMTMAGLSAFNVSPIKYEPIADFDRPKTRKTGKAYPHSSKRQQDRNARQLAAGQISFIQHGPRAA